MNKNEISFINRLHSKVHNLDDVFAGTWEKMKRRSDEPELKLATFPELNYKLWGLQKQRLYVIGARTSQGKSSFISQIAWDVADQGHRTIVYSLEASVDTMMERLFCQQTESDNLKMRRGSEVNKPETLMKAQAFKQAIKDVPLLLLDSIGGTIDELYQSMRLINPKPEVVIIDYIQAIAQLKGERLDVMNEYIRKFREMATRMDFCGILVSQINRSAMGAKDKRPAVWELKGTGVLEEHADVVILLHWDYWYTHDETRKNEYSVLIAKNKDGMTGKVDMNYIPEHYLFSEVRHTAAQYGVDL